MGGGAPFSTAHAPVTAAGAIPWLRTSILAVPSGGFSGCWGQRVEGRTVVIVATIQCFRAEDNGLTMDRSVPEPSVLASRHPFRIYPTNPTARGSVT